MVTFTNPEVGNLQSRIQSLNFGSPNYMSGVSTTTPYFQMGNTMQTYNPQAFNPTASGDVSSYLGYTPQPYVPTNPQFAQPMTPMAGGFARPQGGGGGGDGGLNRFREMQAANAFRNEIKNNPYFDIPEQYKTDLPPGILSFLDTIIGNVPRELAVDRIVRDVDASKDFGVNKYGLGTSYKGSSAMEKDRSPEDREAPTSGPSGSDSSLGKGQGGGGGSGYSGKSAGSDSGKSTGFSRDSSGGKNW